MRAVGRWGQAFKQRFGTELESCGFGGQVDANSELLSFCQAGEFCPYV